MKKLLIFGLIIAVVVVAAVLLLAGNINPIIKAGVEKAGPIVLKAPVNLAEVDISIFSGSGTLKNLMVGNPEGYTTGHAFKMDSLSIDLDPKSVTSDKIHVKSIIIDGPQIIFEGGFGKNNLTQLQANAESFAPSGKKEAAPETSSQTKKLLVVDYIKIANGSISVNMGLLQGKKLTIPLPALEIKDIGKETDATIADVIGEILASINGAVAPAVQTGVGNVTQELQKQGEVLKGQLEGKVEEGMGKIKGLFGN